MQGAVTLVTMAVPIMFSLLALVRLEHHRSTQHEKLRRDRDVVTQQAALLDEGQTLTVSQETLQASALQSSSDNSSHALYFQCSIGNWLLPRHYQAICDVPGLFSLRRHSCELQTTLWESPEKSLWQSQRRLRGSLC